MSVHFSSVATVQSSGVVDTAALVEGGAYDEALQVVRRPFDADRCSPVDHAWLSVHQARCLAEIGHAARAIELAVSVQGLPATVPDDVTAGSIAGAGATLVFRTSGIFEGDVAATITANDTEASWWRAQTLSWGLGSVFDESFRRWTRNDNEVRFGAAGPTERLRGASLVDGFTASHDGWCHTVTLVAKADLIAGNLSIDEAVWSLTALRRAGDVDGVKAAVTHLFETGPAQAVREAIDLIDLNQVAHTEARASLELVIRGADVITAEAANAAARWAIQDPSDRDRWAARVRPSFIVDIERSAVLEATYTLLSSEVRSAVRAFVLGLAPLEDQVRAHAWAGMTYVVPISEWSEDDVAALLQRTGDNREFQEAVKTIGVQRDEALRARNDDLLRAGSLEALMWVGQITNVPPDAVSALITAASAAVRQKIAEARSGVFSFGGRINAGRVLVLANAAFLAESDWAPVLELLNEPTAQEPVLAETLWALQHHGDSLPSDVRASIAEALAAIVRRPPPPPLPMIGGDPRPSARAALEAVAPGTVDLTDWLTVHDWQGRQTMCRSVALRADPADVDILVTLAGDPDPRVRGTAAQALSYWLTDGVAADRALEALKRLVPDDGTHVARRIVSQWPDTPNQRLHPLADSLANHLSAAVRAAAHRVLTAASEQLEQAAAAAALAAAAPAPRPGTRR